jgi:hypothetical protein
MADAWRIGIILAIVLATRTWLLFHTEVTSRDSIAFIHFALQLEEPPPAGSTYIDTHGTRAGVMKATPHPPGYALAIMAVSQPVRALKGTTCDAMVLSAQLANILSALLLTFPLYFLGKQLANRQAAFVGTLLFQALPVWTQVTSDGLSDGLFILMSATAVWFAALGFQRRSGIWFTAAGAVAGAAYLVRPEGLVVALAVFVVLAGCKLRGSWSWRLTLSHAGLYAAALAAVMTPYVATIGKLTNKPTGDAFIYQLEGGKKQQPTWYIPEQSRGPVGGVVPIAAWWRPTDGNRVAWGFKALVSEVGKTAFYVLPFLAGAGLILLRRRIRDEAAMALLVTTIVCQILLLWAVAASAGYVSERHTLPSVMLGCFFAAAALVALGNWVADKLKRGDGAQWAAGMAAVIVVACIPLGLKPLHANRAGHRQAGNWIAQHRHADDFIIDPFGWAEFYGNLRADYAIRQPIAGSYVIVEGADDHPRLHLMRAALEASRHGRLVYHWPENKPVDKAKVRVFYLLMPGHDDDGHNDDRCGASARRN